MIQAPHQVITTHSNSSEGKGAPWTKREISSRWLSRSNQMGHATIFTSPRAEERQQIKQTYFGLHFNQHFMDVFMSLIRMVIYLQSFFSQHNILQTSVTHIWSANGERGEISPGGAVMGLDGQLAPGCSPGGCCLPHYMLRQLQTHTPTLEPLTADIYCRFYYLCM